MASTQAPDGTEIAYTSTGDTAGEAVVLVHGITESSSTWDPIVERLEPRHHVVTIDLRGHGRSGTADRYDLEAMAGDVIMVASELGYSDVLVRNISADQGEALATIERLAGVKGALG